MSMEKSESIVADRVGNVVAELAQLGMNWLDVGVEGWAHGCVLVIHPKAVVRGACCPVSHEDVIRVSDPEATRGLVSVQ